MADKTGIEWTDATWNPIVGCSIVSPGCSNCYAMKMAARIEKMQPASHYAGTTKTVKGNAVWTGKVALAPDRILTQPLRWTKPRRIFVNSMGDLFHEDVPDAWIDRVFAVMALCPQHTFQVLTKRSKRMREYLTDDYRAYFIGKSLLDLLLAKQLPVKAIREDNYPFAIGADEEDHRIKTFPLPNVWLGVSAEDQARADEHIPDLLATPAAIRFVSAEPLLGRIDFELWLDVRGRIMELPPHIKGKGITRGLDWIIAGGESGPGARPMHPDWPRAIRDQCAAAGVPFFFKQWGELVPDRMLENAAKRGLMMTANGEQLRADDATVRAITNGNFDFSGYQHFSRVGKARAGRLLDGRTHDAFPPVKP